MELLIISPRNNDKFLELCKLLYPEDGFADSPLSLVDEPIERVQVDGEDVFILLWVLHFGEAVCATLEKMGYTGEVELDLNHPGELKWLAILIRTWSRMLPKGKLVAQLREIFPLSGANIHLKIRGRGSR